MAALRSERRVGMISAKYGGKVGEEQRGRPRGDQKLSCGHAGGAGFEMSATQDK